jgi:hypothetical protein
MKDSLRFGTSYRSHLQEPNEGQLPTFQDNLSVPSSGVKWRTVIDVSGKPIGPIFRGQMKDSSRRFGITYGSHLHGSTYEVIDVSEPVCPIFRCQLKMVPIGCPDTSVRNYHYSLRNNPGERSSHPLHGGIPKSRLWTAERFRWKQFRTGVHKCVQLFFRAPQSPGKWNRSFD